MKTSARLAYIFILLFFLFFNGLQVYLIIQRINAAKAKFNLACTNTLQSTLFQYNKVKGTDSTIKPKNALISFTMNEMSVNRIDSQNLAVGSPSSRLFALRVDPAVVEPIVNRPRTVSLDLAVLAGIYREALDTSNVHAKFRLDTFALDRSTGKDLQAQIKYTWSAKRTKAYPYATNPQRIFFNPGSLIFAEFKYDSRFFQNDLLWPMLAFFFILLIGNTALVFVYNTIRKQKKINEVKTDFINNITHEMKTPITIASAGLEALEHHVAPTERTDFYLYTTKKQLHLLNDFVERILEAAVQDISDLILKKEKIDLHALFSELVRSHSVVKGKPVSFHVNGEVSVFILGDRLHLQTAFHNIIDNAIKYSNDSVEINIDIVENNRDSIITIRDNGIGIPPQFIKNIFDKFFRVPQGDAQSVKGFGLGLYYVSSIIKKHSGTIVVHSKPQSGTEFVITLPKYT
ncbi:MAG TPA: HAMP domain-containing sensor histidine kinase [Chitinophagaceae bacterium]